MRRIVLDGKRALGVEYEHGGRVVTVRANREVILAASALNSPKLLMLSGIGPAEHLKEVGIAPVKPAEFVVFRIAQFSGGASLAE